MDWSDDVSIGLTFMIDDEWLTILFDHHNHCIHTDNELNKIIYHQYEPIIYNFIRKLIKRPDIIKMSLL